MRRMAQRTDSESDPGTQAALLAVFELLDKRKDLPVCALVCKDWHRACSHRFLWHNLNLAGVKGAGKRLTLLKEQPRFALLKEVNLEFAQGIEDEHVRVLAILDLQVLNLNACQQVSDEGVVPLLNGPAGKSLQTLSIYWNLKVTDATLEAVGARCSQLTDLCVSGCKNMTDAGMLSLAEGLPKLIKLNITRCPKVTDGGLLAVMESNTRLQDLNLYANSMFTDKSFLSLSILPELTTIDLCGMQFLSDAALQTLSACVHLTWINLAWCILVTDVGACALASAVPKLEMLCVYGVRGITDALIDTLAATCSKSLHTLDVRGCVGIKLRSPEELLVKLPNITTFIVHS